MSAPTEVDVMLRQQIFFEAVKDNEADRAEEVTDAVVMALVGAMLKLGFTSFVGIPKSKLTELLTKTRELLSKQFDRLTLDFFDRMQTVLASTLTVTKKNYQFTSGKKVTAKDFNGSTGGNKRLWDKITRDLIPGTGHTPIELVKDFTRSTMAQVALLIKRAYAENWTTEQLVTAIRGTQRLGFKDGVARKIANQYKTVVRTMMQHIQSYLDYHIGKLIYDQYQWLSTLDAVTTAVCRSRHLKIYRYGKGPRPPAHHNCRSRIVGMAGDLSNQTARTFYEWLRGQPSQFLKAALTPREFAAIKNGTAKADDFKAFRNTRRLTAEQFGKRVPLMQLETEG